MLDEKAIIFKVRYLYGKSSRICGRYKREGGCALPGEVCRAAVSANDIERCRDGSTEVSRGHSRRLDYAEGPNVKYR